MYRKKYPLDELKNNPKKVPDRLGKNLAHLIYFKRTLIPEIKEKVSIWILNYKIVSYKAAIDKANKHENEAALQTELNDLKLKNCANETKLTCLKERRDREDKKMNIMIKNQKVN